jgi:hypothetical protein
VPGRHLEPDIRLGDVVVRTPEDDSDDEQGVIDYELGKETVDGFVKKNWRYPTNRRLRRLRLKILSSGLTRFIIGSSQYMGKHARRM